MPPNIQGKLEDEARTALKKAKALFDAKNMPVETVLEAGLVPANLIIARLKMASLTASSSAAPARMPWRGY